MKIPFRAISLLLSTLTPRFANAFADCLKETDGDREREREREIDR